MPRPVLLPSRAAAAVLLAVLALVAGAPLAAAHVTVSAEGAAPGHYTRAVFRVPNERSDASTVRVEVTFPTEHPLGRASVAPVPGWTASVRSEKLAAPVHGHGGAITEAVAAITWQGGEVKPGEFLEFPVSFGPVPHDAPRLVFKALQTYSDGQVVRWIEVPADGRPEPEHPAPVLSLAAGAGAAHGGGADALARTLGVVAAATSLAALVACVALGVAIRRRPAPLLAAPPHPATAAAPPRQRAKV